MNIIIIIIIIIVGVVVVNTVVSGCITTVLEGHEVIEKGACCSLNQTHVQELQSFHGPNKAKQYNQDS